MFKSFSHVPRDVTAPVGCSSRSGWSILLSSVVLLLLRVGSIYLRICLWTL